ncbi:MAG: DUF2029 domain-containing protein [Candidatus Lokiarchaeota archaeon]|nr:DUF2029 domain-containing protein [Candidatus Lokiarchaeota archaeon]
MYYQAGNNFLSDIINLYSFPYVFPFRYFPLSAVLFVPFSLLPYGIAFILFTFITLFLNILICVVLYKLYMLIVINRTEKTEKRFFVFMSVYLMSFPVASNYVLGQINLFVSLLVLISLYTFIKYDSKNSHMLGGVLLGMSALIKPITVCMIPFLILAHYDLSKKKISLSFKKSVIRIIGFIIPLACNLIVFFLFPSLLEDFVSTNFTSKYAITANPSFSVTKLFTNFFLFYDINFDQLVIFLCVLIIIGLLAFIIYILKVPGKNTIVYGYLLGMIVMFLSYFDSWDHHLVVFTPILILIMINFPENSKTTKIYLKPGFFALSFLNLIGFGVWFLIYEYFPYNFVSTIFLFWILFGLGKHIVSENLKGDNINHENDEL